MQPHATDNTAAYATLRAIKGAPLAILITLFIRGISSTQTWLTATTGYSPKTVRTALASLHALGFVQRLTPHLWALPNGQLPLPGFSPETGNFSPGLPPTTTTLIDVVPHLEQPEVEAPNREKISLLAAAGIGEPMRTRLAHLPHATPAYISEHTAQARRDGIPTGLLIHRILQADPTPRQRRPTYCQGPLVDTTHDPDYE